MLLGALNTVLFVLVLFGDDAAEFIVLEAADVIVSAEGGIINGMGKTSKGKAMFLVDMSLFQQ